MDSTKVFVDSINAVIKFSSDIPAPKQEWYANWDNVAVVAIIAFAMTYTITKCVDMYFAHKKDVSSNTMSIEKEKREWEVEDRKQKQNAELKSMRFERLKELEKIDKKYTEVFNKELGIKIPEDTNN